MDGWYDEHPKPTSNIYGLEYQSFNKEQEKKKNQTNFACHNCKTVYDNPNKDS